MASPQTDDNKADNDSLPPNTPAMLRNLISLQQSHDGNNLCLQWCKQKEPDACSKVCLLKQSKEADGRTTESPLRYNPLQGYSVAMMHHKQDAESTVFQMDLGQQLDNVSNGVERVANASYQVYQNYVESWKDGSQSAFFERMYETTKNSDHYKTLKEHAAKATDLIWGRQQDDESDSNKKQ